MDSDWSDVVSELARGDRGEDAKELAPLVFHLFSKCPTLSPGLSHTTFTALKQHSFEGIVVFLSFQVLLPRPALRFQLGLHCDFAASVNTCAARTPSRSISDETQCDDGQAYQVIDNYCEVLSRIDELVPVLIRHIQVP